MCFETESVMVLQSQQTRSLIFAPIESDYATSCQSSIVNSYLAPFQRYCRFSVENIDPNLLQPNFGGIPLGLDCRCCGYDPSSTTRTPATDMLYNATNGQAHNNCTTCCTTNSPTTDKNLPHRNARDQHLFMSCQHYLTKLKVAVFD